MKEANHGTQWVNYIDFLILFVKITIQTTDWVAGFILHRPPKLLPLLSIYYGVAFYILIHYLGWLGLRGVSPVFIESQDPPLAIFHKGTIGIIPFFVVVGDFLWQQCHDISEAAPGGSCAKSFYQILWHMQGGVLDGSILERIPVFHIRQILCIIIEILQGRTLPKGLVPKHDNA